MLDSSSVMLTDTSKEAMNAYVALLRAQTPEQRMRTIDALTEGVRRMVEAGIREEFPRADDHEVKLRLAVRLYGREIVERHFGPVPSDAR